MAEWADADAENWLKIFTFLPKEEIASLIELHKADAASRNLQKRLAQELTVFVHGEEEYNLAIETTQKLFAQQNASADSLSAEDLENMQGIIKIRFATGSLEEGIDVINLVTNTSIFSSKGEAKKMIQNGGLSINREKVTDAQMQVTTASLLHKKYLLVQRGKKNYFLIIAAE